MTPFFPPESGRTPPKEEKKKARNNPPPSSSPSVRFPELSSFSFRFHPTVERKRRQDSTLLFFFFFCYVVPRGQGIGPILFRISGGKKRRVHDFWSFLYVPLERMVSFRDFRYAFRSERIGRTVLARSSPLSKTWPTASYFKTTEGFAVYKDGNVSSSLPFFPPPTRVTAITPDIPSPDIPLPPSVANVG